MIYTQELYTQVVHNISQVASLLQVHFDNTLGQEDHMETLCRLKVIEVKREVIKVFS